jgi:chorismate dehydratase
MPLRIGHVRYLNTLPLVEGLHAWREVELVQAVPAELAPMLWQQPAPAIDVGLCSVIDAARSPIPLTLIPAGMIGCEGPTLTVRLCSAVPWQEVRRLHADTDSHTSVVLARILLKRRFGVEPEIIDFDAVKHEEHAPNARANYWPETLLIIGDKVVTDAPPTDRYPHQLDLGEAWHAYTGLPFVYAVWMARSADTAAQDSPLRLVADLLARQRARNTHRLDWLVDRYATQRGWPPNLARHYVGHLLRYTVGPRERDAVARFLHEAADLKLCPTHQPAWLD